MSYYGIRSADIVRAIQTLDMNNSVRSESIRSTLNIIDASVNNVTTSLETNGVLSQGSVSSVDQSYIDGQVKPLSLTPTGALKVDIGSASISATVTADAVDQGTTTLGQKGTLIQGAVTSGAPTYDTGEINPLSLTTTGALRVDIGGTSITADGVAQDSTTAGQNGILQQGAVTTLHPTYNNNKTNQLSLNTNGELRTTDDGILSSGNTTTTNISGQTTLNETLDGTDTTITLTSTAQFQTSGTIKIDSEYITYSGISGSDLTGCVRGAFNSTATTHTNGTSVIGVFIGTAELNGKSDIAVSLTSSTSGTEYFDFLNDGSIWSTYPVTGFTVTANVHEFHVAVKSRRYFRIRFENGSSSATTSFKIYTYYGTFNQGKLPLNQSISSDADSIVVRSVATGADPNGTYVNLQADGYVFTTSTPLTANSSYTSSIYSTSGYSQIQTELFSDQTGTLVGTWYSDSAGTNLIRTFTRPFDTAGTYVYFSAPVFGPYVKYVYTNGTTNQTSFFLGLKFLTKSISGQVIGVNDFISTTMVANLGRNILVGQTDGGDFVNVPVTSEGHLEVALHDPILPFGSIHVENMRAIFQADAVYGINLGLSNVFTTLSGSATNNNNLFEANTGTTQFGFCAIESRKRLRYRAGQGLIIRYTGIFTAPVANSYQLIGF